MTHTATTVLSLIIEGYEAALQHIAERLRENNLTSVTPDFSDTMDRTFNVNRHNGASDEIISVSLVGDHLTFTGESGTVYPVGEDIDGQDDYVLANLDTLVLAVDKTVLGNE